MPVSSGWNGPACTGQLNIGILPKPDKNIDFKLLGR